MYKMLSLLCVCSVSFALEREYPVTAQNLSRPIKAIRRRREISQAARERLRRRLFAAFEQNVAPRMLRG